MANQGVFMRNDNSLTPIKRSLQNLSHRHTTTTRYGQIIPMFAEQMYPGEKIRINMTNFIRTIPMLRPQLSRVKVVTRFIAVPNRIMWFGFEEYIKSGVSESNKDLTEPYIANFNAVKINQCNVDFANKKLVSRVPIQLYTSVRSASNKVQAQYEDAVDWSVLGVSPDYIALANGHDLNYAVTPVAFSRAVRIESDKSFPAVSDLYGYQFFPNELGDYLNAPLYVPSLASDVSGRLSAYKFAAYQMAYSYFYRQPNVQDKVDDYYEMQAVYPSQRQPEFPSFFTLLGTDTPEDGSLQFSDFMPPVAADIKYSADGWHGFIQGKNTGSLNVDQLGYAINPAAIGVARTSPDGTDVENCVDNPGFDQDLVSWSNVEKFPLKSGVNLSMQAIKLNDDGVPTFSPSRISLTRIRYANWQSDRFTTANPWPQRGTEAQIPVVGSAALDGFSLGITVKPTANEYLKVYTTADGKPAEDWNPSPDPVLFRVNDVADVGGDTGALPSNSVGDYVPFGGQHPHMIGNAGFQVWPSHPTGRVYVASAYITPESVSGTNDYEAYGTGGFYSQPRLPALGIKSSHVGSVLQATGNGTLMAQGLYVSPSSFRFAMQLQKIKEMSARTDDRYKSFMSMFYGSHVPDERIDRPTFIGGMVQELNVSEIQQNSVSEDSPLGSLAGRGISAKKSNRISFVAREHTVIMALVHIIPDTEYIGGLNREDHKTDPFDWVMPQFAGLSEQPIRNAELSLQPTALDGSTNAKNDEAFGYEPRFNELRAKHSYATGAFRDVMNTTGSREYYKPWLIIRNFGIQGVAKFYNSKFAGFSYVTPTLSSEFLSMRHTVDNSNFAVSDEAVMYPFMLDSYFSVRWTRIVPSRGVPRI